MIAKRKRFLARITAALICLSIVPSELALANVTQNDYVLFQNFEDAAKVDITSTANSSAGTITSTEKYDGVNSLKYDVVDKGGDPKIDKGSVAFTSTSAGGIDASGLKYLVLWVKDTQGSNGMKVAIKDASGKESGFDGNSWIAGKTVLNKWTEISIPMETLLTSGVDVTKITEVRVGQWNTGTYYVDKVSFVNVLESEKEQPLEDSNTISYEPEWVQTFDGTDAANTSFEATTGTNVSLSDKDSRKGSALEYNVLASGSPEINSGSIKIKSMDGSLDARGQKYLAFWIKDTQGSNTLKASLIDENGSETDFGSSGWMKASTKIGEWTQYYIPIESLVGTIDKSKVSGFRIGQWNSGKYVIDSAYLTNYLYQDVPTLTPNSPKANLISGKYTGVVSVELNSATKNTEIHYTTDGSEPSAESPKYSAAISIDKSTSVKAISVKNGENSAVETFEYVIEAGIPSNVKTNKEPGKYSANVSVGLSTETTGTKIYYTVNGSEPGITSNTYSTPIEVSNTTTIKAVSYKNGKLGNVISLDYILPSTPKIPISSLETGKQTKSGRIELISDNGAKIYYTTDGTNPTIKSTLYKAVIAFDKTMTIKAIAVRDGLISEMATLSYNLVPYPVVADKPAGTYDDSVIVEFRTKSDKDEMYYTTDGTEPSKSSTLFTQPIKVRENTTFKVTGYSPTNNEYSEVKTFNFIINKVTKVFNPKIFPAEGTYTTAQQVTLSTETEGAKIYYTTDGTKPTKTSKEYTGAIQVDKNTLVKAIAAKDGYLSEVVLNDYVIDKTKTPFLKANGKVLKDNFGSGNTVTLRGTNAGGWLVTEAWQCPLNAKDQKTALDVFTERFGSEEKAWDLINTYQDNWWTEADFDQCKAEGMNMIRLPITYFEMMNADGSLKETAFDRLQWFVDQCAKRNMYVLIDMHGAVGSQNGKDHSGDISNPDVGNFFGNEENIQQTIKLWEEIAKRYQNNAWVAGYDLLNEPGGALGTEQFEAYDRIYDAIRAIDKNHSIYIQAIWEPFHLPAPELYGWENVVYQYHFYGWGDINNADYQKTFIDSKVQMVNEMTNYNVPTFIGEFTFFSNLDSWKYGLDVFEREGWSYTTWTYKVTGKGSSWGMFTGDPQPVDIYKDSFDEIQRKWSTVKTSESFTRNDKFADVLKPYFKLSVENDYSNDEEPGDNQGGEEIDNTKITTDESGNKQLVVSKIADKDAITTIKIGDAKGITVEITDINAIKNGTGSIKIVSDGVEIKIPYSSIDKSLLVDGAKLLFKFTPEDGGEITKGIKGTNKVYSFNLFVVNNGISVPVTKFAQGEVEITFTLTDEELKDLDASNLGVFYYNEETKNLEFIESTIDGNKVSFKTSHFSKYIIAEKIIRDGVVITPKTGDVNMINGLIIFAAISLVGIIALRKREAKAQ